MDYAEIRQWILSFGGPDIKSYAHTVIRDSMLPIRGIPMGELRGMAKKLSKGEWTALFQQARWDSFEEVLLLGLTVAYAREAFSVKLPYLRRVLPHLDSWAHTDSIVPTLKLKEEERQEAWDFTLECLQSSREYTIRFGILMLMRYFSAADKLAHTLTLLINIWDQGYYVRMAIAWCLAEIAVEHYQAVESILQAQALDTFTHNKTIQKIRESYRICPEHKERANALKRKERKQ